MIKTSLLTLITILFTTLITSTGYASNPISPELPEFFASYDAEIKGFSVTAQRTLGKKSESTYQLTFTAKSLLANLTEQSVFDYKEGSIQSKTYHYEQKALGKTRKRSLQFKPQNKTVISHYKEQEKTLNTIGNAFDALNYQLALQLDIAAGKTSGIYNVISKDSLKHYQFTVIGQEPLKTAVGTLDTTKIEIHRENKNKVTYIWLANNWHYLLVSLEQYEGDKKKLSIQLNKANINGQNISSK